MIRVLRRMEICSDGLLLLSFLVFFTELPVLMCIIGNVLIHEWGHIYFLRRYGVYVRRVSVKFTGLCIRCNLNILGKRENFLCAAGGPAAGLCAALAASFCGNLFGCQLLLLFAGTGVVLSTFNLIPVYPMDGWRMLYSIFPKAAKPIGDVCAVLLLLAGLYVMALGYGTALACLGIFFLMRGRYNPHW